MSRRPQSIATRTGDSGTTSLLYGERVSKTHPQIEALGTLDELNVALGGPKTLGVAPATRELLEAIQQSLVALMGEIACSADTAPRYAQSQFEKLGEADLARLDAALAALETRGLRFEGWARPGQNPIALAYDQARVTARRAERRLIALTEHTPLRALLLSYINRLSDLLWLLAREAETAQ